MTISEANLGFSVADAEDVEIQTNAGDLYLRFTDWRESSVRHTFVDVVGFRWGAVPTVDTPRDDMAYEVADSAWLLTEAQIEGCAPRQLVHFVLCFNALGTLEVICRRRQQ